MLLGLRFSSGRILRKPISSASVSAGRSFRSGCLACAAVLSIALPNLSGALAQPPPSPAPSVSTSDDQAQSPTETITAEKLDQLREQITAAPELNEESRKKILETVQKASEAIGRAVKLETQAPLDQASIDAVATKLKERQAELAAPAPPMLDDVPADASLAELTSALATRKPRLDEAKQKFEERDLEPTRRLERRSAIVNDQATYATRKAEIEKELAAAAPAEEAPLATAARRSLLLARLREILAEAAAHRVELAKYDNEKAVDLPALRTQLARREVTRLQQEFDELNRRIATKRSQDARYIAEQLSKFAAGEAVPTPYEQSAVPSTLFAGSLTRTADLEEAALTAGQAQDNVDLTIRLTKATTDATASQKALENLRAQKTRTKEKVTRVGLTGAIGLELRKQLWGLPDPGLILQQCSIRQEEMRDLEYQRLEAEDKTSEFSERIDALEKLEVLSDDQKVELRLAKDRLTTLNMLIKNYGECFNKLGELDSTEQEYVREVDDFSTFIRERVLWIRSNRLPGPEDIAETVSTIQWLTSASRWQQVGATLWQDAQARIWLYFLLTFMVILLFAVQPRFRRNLTQIGQISAKSTCQDFQPTVRAAVLTLILSLPWPVIPGFVGWRLLFDAQASSFTRAVGQGCLTVAAGYLSLNLLRQLCRPSGLGLAHFEWPAHAVVLLRTRIRTMMLLLLPLLFVQTLLHAEETPLSRAAVERSVFVISLILLAWFQAKILHPVTGVFRDYLANKPTNWVYRIRWLLYWMVVAIPLILSLLAVFGYYYTAYELSWRLDTTILILTVLLVLRSFLIRWFVLRHRQLRIEQARLRRKAMADEPPAEQGTSSVPRPLPQETAVDLKEVSEQTQRFIDSGLALLGLAATWFVWVNVLPALGILDQWELWTTTVDVTAEYKDQDGRKSFRTEPQLQSITVADALISILLTLLTFTAARNVPGLLQITVLQRLPLEPAGRYAVQMMARYVIVVVGMVFACNAIGVGWSQVQWLAAALTVGLGFGLQEIFANFVSGLIILFERPIRIGDVVTIGDVSGVVSRIQIRATTITDWDRKEYIVPNKEFVTGRLLNWTLSDTTNRVVINVGVAYGTDTVLARSLLIQAAQEHPDVLSDPPPIATFEGFGDSTLNLILRCYLPNLDNRLRTITELHEAIDREFRLASLEIAFPQLDLHVRSTSAGAGDRAASGSETRPPAGDHSPDTLS